MSPQVAGDMDSGEAGEATEDEESPCSDIVSAIEEELEEVGVNHSLVTAHCVCSAVTGCNIPCGSTLYSWLISPCVGFRVCADRRGAAEICPQ